MTWKNKFQFALWAVVLYPVLMLVVKPDNSSILKLAITLLLGIPIFFTIEYCLINHKYIKRMIPDYAFSFFALLLFLNFVNIIRGSMHDGVTLTTAFGNPYTALSLLTPLALGFGVTTSNLKILSFVFRHLVSIGLIAAICILIMGFTFGHAPINQIKAAFVMISPIIFLIGTVAYNRRKNQYFIYFVSFLFVIFGLFIIDQRAIPFRITLLYLSNIAVYFCWKYRFRWIRQVAICILLIPFFILQNSVNSGESFFSAMEKTVSSNSSINNFHGRIDTSDTRTFLYNEVYNDLKRTNSLLFGKGSSGTYYSHFFNRSKGDSDTRLTVEVGILAMLLKGGFVAVIINLLLFYTAIYLALFKANNQYVMWVGFMLLTHTLILFIENIPSYDIYNFSIWFFTGICLSQEVRALSDKEIKSYLSFEANDS